MEKNLSKEQVTIFCRDNLEKFTVELTEMFNKIKVTLDIIQKGLFQKQIERVKNKLLTLKILIKF